MHEQEDALSMWAPEPTAISGTNSLLQLTFAFACVGAFAYALYLIKPEPTFVPRTYPYNGLSAELGSHEGLGVSGILCGFASDLLMSVHHCAKGPT